mmetsp:Transcript_102748/g.257663  ORF Transcript_102748/g.257663 Transcript_102748/m.257663 type:complete len:377 (+) Transcript_102748:857-1987(+)
MAVEALRSTLRCGAEEGQVSGTVWRVVAKPRHAPAGGLGFQDVRPRAAMHGDCTLPQASDAPWRDRSAVGSPERAGSHACSQVVWCALVVVTQHVHDHLGRDGALGSRNRTRVGILSLWEVALIGVQLRTLGWAEEAEDAPHAAAAVEGECVLHHLCRSRIACSACVGCVPVGSEKVEEAGQIILRTPPAQLFSELRDPGAIEEVVRIAQVHLPDREGVPDSCNVAGWHALSCPNGASVLGPRHHIENPELLRISNHQSLSAVSIVGMLRLTAVGAVEALVNCDVAHGLHCAASCRTPLQSDLREILNACMVVSVRPVWRRRPTYGPGRASALTDGEALLVLNSVVHVPVSIGLRHLWDCPDGHGLLLTIHWCVLW